jgi:thioredoxin reductase
MLMSDKTLTFDGARVSMQDGQSLAAALVEAGHRAFRYTASSAKRGLFCGMGVCQDCLVNVDGAPNVRACMIPAQPGQVVKTQVAFATLEEPRITLPSQPTRKLTPDVLIIGGGAGGLSAAIAARRMGAEVLVLDERKVPGGQYYKQSADGPPLDRQQADGAALLVDAKASGAEILDSVEIWGAFDGPLYLGTRNGAALIIRPKTSIISTGAYERPRMVPGWTLPGVMTTGAAQTLWRSYRTLPGARVAVCGSGPLNLQVALELAQGGAQVALVTETAPHPATRPLHLIGAGMADPTLTLKGWNMIRQLRKNVVPLLYRTDILEIVECDNGLDVTLQGPRGDRQTVTVDALCMNFGFEPQNEILRLLGAEMTYDPAFGHLRCIRTDTCETTVQGIFAVGDCAGLGGALAAMVEGRIAGVAAAAKSGHDDGYNIFADQRTLGRYRRFQKHLWHLYSVAPHSLQNAPDEVIICRCEEITMGQIRSRLKATPGHIGTLKRATRVGMGRCQGRYCGAVAARIVAETTGKPMEDFSHFAPRVPIKPVSIAAIIASEEELDNVP